MAKVPGTLSKTKATPLNGNAWEIIEKNAYKSYEKFVKKKTSKSLNIAKIAAECGYIPAEQHALKFVGSPYMNMSSGDRHTNFVNPINNDIIIPFLDGNDFSDIKCLEVMEKVVKKASDVPDFTFGNAQKWINMSIKYYLILSAYSVYPNGIDESNVGTLQPLKAFYDRTKFYQYKLMPIDTPMCKHVSADLGCLSFPVYTPYPWSRNNNSKEFIDYWKFVNTKITKNWKGFIPLLYEIYVW